MCQNMKIATHIGVEITREERTRKIAKVNKEFELVVTRAQGYERLLLGILCFVDGLETAWE